MFLEDLAERLIHSKRDLDNLRDLYDLVGRREHGAIRFYRDQLELLMLLIKRNDVIAKSPNICLRCRPSMMMGKNVD